MTMRLKSKQCKCNLTLSLSIFKLRQASSKKQQQKAAYEESEPDSSESDNNCQFGDSLFGHGDKKGQPEKVNSQEKIDELKELLNDMKEVSSQLHYGVDLTNVPCSKCSNDKERDQSLGCECSETNKLINFVKFIA